MTTDPQVINLSKDAVDEMQLGHLVKFVDWHESRSFFSQGAGHEHYKLLAYLSTQLHCKRILDIGTYFGHSCNALSYAPDKEVLSFDVADRLPLRHASLDPEHGGIASVKDRPNVRCMYTDYMADLADLVCGCDLVVIDDDHTGRTQRRIMQRLREVKYTGLVLIDDTRLNSAMLHMFADIPETKVDVTSVGHWSGTGIIVFDTARFTVRP